MTNHEHILILLDGSARREPWISDIANQAYIIAADGGIRHADLLDVRPDLWIGDFDSSSVDMHETYRDIPKSEYETDKIKSDGELAIEKALSFNPAQITLLGALGGERTDHSLFNILGALRFAHQYKSCKFVLVGDRQTAMPLVPGKRLEISPRHGSILSIVPFSHLDGLTITGVRWPLNSEQVELGSTHTLSNVIVSHGNVELAGGLAIAIVQIKD